MKHKDTEKLYREISEYKKAGLSVPEIADKINQPIKYVANLIKRPKFKDFFQEEQKETSETSQPLSDVHKWVFQNKKDYLELALDKLANIVKNSKNEKRQVEAASKILDCFGVITRKPAVKPEKTQVEDIISKEAQKHLDKILLNISDDI